jgi:HEAT repeat protein
MTQRLSIQLVLGVLLSVSFVTSAQVDKWIADLGGDNDQARSTARQMLPREGLEVLPRLLPLFRDDRDPVWRAVRMTIADIANSVSVPGKEAEQANVAGILMSLLAPAESETVKIRVLELLPIVVPEGFDIGPIAFLLKDEVLQARALQALYEIGTVEARAAMRNALPSAAPAFQFAVIDDLVQSRDAESVPLYVQLSLSDTPEVRVSAARGLAVTGNPRYMDIIRRVYESTSGQQQFEAGKAVVRHADEIIAAGGNYHAAMQICRAMAEAEGDPELRAAALVGIGRHGDAEAVPYILSVIQQPGNELLIGPGIAALGAVRGKEARDRLIAAFDGLAPEIQIPLVLGFGQKGDPAYLEPLQQAAASENEDLRNAALTALVSTRVAEAVAPLVAAAEASEGDQRAQRLVDLSGLADALRADGNAKGAGEAFLALYRLSEDEGQRARALEGVRQFPVAEAYDVILNTFGEEELAKLATETKAGIIQALHEAGRAEEAKAAYEELLNGSIDAQAASEVLRVGEVLGYGAELRSRLGFLTEWWMIGPFAWSLAEDFNQQYLDAKAIDLAAELKDGDAARTWAKQTTEDRAGLLELSGRFGMISNACVFAYAQIEVPEATDAQLRIGTDDGVKAWVNGEAVHENNVDRGLAMDSDVVPIHLEAGRNEILLQVTQRAGGWAMAARLTDGEGKVLSFTMAE